MHVTKMPVAVRPPSETGALMGELAHLPSPAAADSTTARSKESLEGLDQLSKNGGRERREGQTEDRT